MTDLIITAGVALVAGLALGAWFAWTTVERSFQRNPDDWLYILQQHQSINRMLRRKARR